MYELKTVNHSDFKDFDAVDKIFKENWKTIETEDKKAKKAGILIGRYIDHPFADGHAMYAITRDSKKTVSLECLQGIGDDWVLPAWGYKTRINKQLALEFLRRRDRLAELFGKKK